MCPQKSNTFPVIVKKIFLYNLYNFHLVCYETGPF